jgi:hypothetical protein
MQLLQAALNLQKEAHSKGKWDKELQQKYNNIDNTATDIMLKAEKTCAPKYPHLIQWSCNLLQQGLKLRYLLLYRAYTQGKNITENHLENQAKRAGISHTLCTPSKIKEHIIETRQKLQQIRKKHTEERQQFLQKLSEEYSQNGNLSAQKILQAIIEREHIKKIHRNIRHALGKGRHSSLLRLTIPSSSPNDNITITHTTNDKIHEEITQHNIKHYSKAENSPVGINTPLYDKIGPHGNSPFCDRILQGTMTIDDLNEIPMPETVELLKSTMSPFAQLNQEQIKIDMEPDDYTAIFSKWNEKTSTSPSGRHLGHYKAILQQPELIQYHCIMATLPLTYGFAPERWSKAVQIMLEKKPGYPLINRLRGIIILDADYNWVLRTIWGNRLFKKVTYTQSLIQAQQARPGHQSIIAALNKVLAYDLLRLTRSPGGEL